MITSIDSETFKIKPGLLAPKLVCVSYATHRGKDPLRAEGAGKGSFTRTVGLLHREEGLAFVRKQLAGPDILVGQNIPYDFAVFCARDASLLPLVFEAYEAGRVRCTRIRQKLLDIAAGEHKFYREKQEDGSIKTFKTKHSLDALVWRHFHRVLPKQGTFRLRYSELDEVPIEKWPEEAKTYAMRDAVETLDVGFAQQRIAYDSEYDVDSFKPLPDEIPQTAAAFALHLMSVWGLRTDKKRVIELRDAILRDSEEARAKLLEWGYLRGDGVKGKKAGSRDLAKIRERVVHVCAERGLIPQLTDTGLVSTDGDFLESLDDEHLNQLAEVQHGNWILTSWVPTLLAGADHPINPPYNPLMETGRTACGDGTDTSFNIQNPPRKGGVRECFIPRPGRLFCGCDYDTIELRAWAQACLDLVGESEMAKILIAGRDPHSDFGAWLGGMSYEEFAERLKQGDPRAEELRQFAKIANFGIPGGMSAEALVAYAKGYGINLTFDQARELHRRWKQRFPEEKPYFSVIKTLTRGSEGTITQLRSGRIRGGVSYTQGANGFFQGLTADGAKAAIWAVTRACYVDRKSPLYGSRCGLFLHDELIPEVPEVSGHEAAMELRRIMVDEMQKYMPDVPVKASPVLMRRWYKGAKAVYVNERLVPSKPSVDEKGNKRWVADV